MANVTPHRNKNGEVNSYYIRVCIGRDRKGKQLFKNTKWTVPKDLPKKQIQRELNKFVIQFEEECINGTISVNTKMTLEDFCEIYLEIAKTTLAPQTYKNYKHEIETLIIPSLGHIHLSKLQNAHIQKFVMNLQGTAKKKNGNESDNKTISPATVKRKLAILQSILTQAVKLGYIQSNPADAKKLALPKQITPEVDIFTKQEAAEIILHLENEPLQYQVLIQLAIITGCRRGELIGLKFSDFNFISKKVTISRSAYKLTGEPTKTKPPKDNQVRTISISSEIIELIRILKQEKENEALRIGTEWHDENWLFTQWNGQIMHPHTPTSWFADFLEKYGMLHRKFHALRHTSATLLLYADTNIRQVQERLGHGNLKTTQMYVHCISEADEEATNKLQSMLITQKVKSNKEVGVPIFKAI